MRFADTLSGLVGVRENLIDTLRGMGGGLAQSILAIHHVDSIAELNDPEASQEVIITAAAFSGHYKELAGMLPANLSSSDLGLIIEAISEENGLVITNLALQRREALELLRQPGIFSFKKLSLEQQKIAHRLQQYVATLNDEQLNNVVRIINPEYPPSRGGTRGRVLYKAPIVRK